MSSKLPIKRTSKKKYFFSFSKYELKRNNVKTSVFSTLTSTSKPLTLVKFADLQKIDKEKKKVRLGVIT